MKSNSLVSTGEQLADYAGTVGAMRTLAASISLKQPGDPRKLSLAMLQLADAAQPPVRLLLGSDTVRMVREKNRFVEQELGEWIGLSLSTDHDDAAAARPAGVAVLADLQGRGRPAISELMMPVGTARMPQPSSIISDATARPRSVFGTRSPKPTVPCCGPSTKNITVPSNSTTIITTDRNTRILRRLAISALRGAGGSGGGSGPWVQLRGELKGVSDVERITARIALRQVRPRELPPEGCTDLLRRAIAEEPAALVRDGGVIASGFDTELDELRAIQTNCDSFLLELETREKARTGIPNLRVQFNKVHGFYIEVTGSYLDRVPDDYRRRQTLKNAERFITPELKTFEDKALSANERALAREKWLYEQILDQLQPHVPALTQLAQALAALDVLCTLAERSLTLNWCAPQFAPEPCIDIEGGRHPVVEARLAETSNASFIANHTRLTANTRMQIITGPNMGGKSTYMRQVALITLLACMGSHVPASSVAIAMAPPIASTSLT
eukprot:gene28763-35679_t